VRRGGSATVRRGGSATVRRGGSATVRRGGSATEHPLEDAAAALPPFLASPRGDVAGELSGVIRDDDVRAGRYPARFVFAAAHTRLHGPSMSTWRRRVQMGRG